MNSYKQIQAQIARLQRDADEARKTEIATVVEKLKKSIALYGLTAADIGLDDAGRSSTRKGAVGKAAGKPAGRKTASAKTGRPGAGVAKYRDPKSGATWSGFGRIPGWLASVKDREAFRIGNDAAPAGAESPAAAAELKPAVKAARKTGAKAARKAGAKAAAKKAVAAKKAASAKRPAAKKGAAARRSAAAQPAVGAAEEPSASALPPAAPKDGGQDASPAERRPDETTAG